jgi:hypothetical protein
VLVKAGAEIPQLACHSRRVAGWNLIDRANAYDLDASLRKQGWYFLFFVPRIEASAFALTSEAVLQKAGRKVFRKADLQGFNALEITTIRKRNYLGMKYVRLAVHPHEVRTNPYSRYLDPHRRLSRMRDFKRIHQAVNRQIKQVKAI